MAVKNMTLIWLVFFSKLVCTEGYVLKFSKEHWQATISHVTQDLPVGFFLSYKWTVCLDEQ